MHLARLYSQMKRDRPICCGFITAAMDGLSGRVIVDPGGELPERALELRARLALLAEEQLTARESGLTVDPEYAEDLALEVGETRFAHTCAVVFRLAFMRAALDGRSQG